MRLLLGSIMCCLALLAFACGDGAAPSDAGTPTARPTMAATPTGEVTTGDLPHPPDLTVTLGDASIAAEIGTFCWSEGGRGGCADAIGVNTPNLALVAEGQPPLTAELQSGRPESATATAWRVDQLACDPNAPSTGECGAMPAGQGYSWPMNRLGQGRELPVEVAGGTLRVTSSLESGVYVISLSLVFERGGDANYGVLVAFLPVEG